MPNESKKINCWEFKKCGREQGGEHAHDLGVCPSAIEKKLDGVHNGMNAGRACWLYQEHYARERSRAHSPGNLELAWGVISTFM